MSVMTIEHGMTEFASRRDCAGGDAGRLALSAGAAPRRCSCSSCSACRTCSATPPPQDTPIAVELVTIAPETRATHPNPYQPKREAKPEPAVAPPAPKPKPEPPPEPAAAEPPSSAAPPPSPSPTKPERKSRPLPRRRRNRSRRRRRRGRPSPSRGPSRGRRAKPRDRTRGRRTPGPLPSCSTSWRTGNSQQHPQPAAFDALLKNLTRQPTAQTEDAPPAPRQMASAAPSSQPKAPLGSRLTASELDALAEQVVRQLAPCWNVPAGVRDAKDLNVEIRAAVNADGTVRQAAIVEQGRLGDPLFRAAAESARRTFFNPTCTPLQLPADKYEVWKNLVVNFNPKDLL